MVVLLENNRAPSIMEAMPFHLRNNYDTSPVIYYKVYIAACDRPLAAIN